MSLALIRYLLKAVITALSSLPNPFVFKQQIKIAATPLFIDLGTLFKKVFGDSQCLQKNMMGEEYLQKLACCHKTLPIIGVSYLKEQQNNKNLSLRIHTPDGNYDDLPFMAHSILSVFNI
ncbi:hypothetical protein [Yersinia rochesterensis]|uniref:hypothetical protein n=1 Tax=Yersinia rochesterensis TaxID=1604335 RepID=UPI0011A77FDD|nr:hypothetical protein [Yersinia rochesterensis]